MKRNKKVRIEIRFDEVEDKEMIRFIDENGSTRAGFIKQILKMYKNQSDKMTINTFSEQKSETIKSDNPKKERKSLSNVNDISFSSKDLN